MDRMYIVIIIGIVAAIFVVFFFLPGSKSSSKSTTTLPTMVSPGQTTGPTTTIVPATVDINAVNVEYAYSGPSQKNGQTCSYQSRTYIDSSDARIVNGSQYFYIKLQPSSGNCAEQFTNVTTSTAGFRVVSVLPQLPYVLPPSSQAEIQIEIETPDVNFYGPLSITLNYD